MGSKIQNPTHSILTRKRASNGMSGLGDSTDSAHPHTNMAGEVGAQKRSTNPRPRRAPHSTANLRAWVAMGSIRAELIYITYITK